MTSVFCYRFIHECKRGAENGADKFIVWSTTHSNDRDWNSRIVPAGLSAADGVFDPASCGAVIMDVRCSVAVHTLGRHGDPLRGRGLQTAVKVSSVTSHW